MEYVAEEQFSDASATIRGDVDAIFSMARSETSLSKLQQAEDNGMVVVNSSHGVRLCSSRQALDKLMRTNAIPAAPRYQGGAGWVKSDRGHQVSFGADEKAVESLRKSIGNPVITEHVAGEDVKFYGVSDLFFYPSGYPVLQQVAVRIARLADVRVYGGDAIVRPDGSFVIVDFNDWPSFSSCLEEAAAAISDLL